jgi:hypothetical protein
MRNPRRRLVAGVDAGTESIVIGFLHSLAPLEDGTY